MRSNLKLKAAFVIVILDFLFLAYPSVFKFVVNDPINYYRLTSLTLLLLNTVLLFLWRDIKIESYIEPEINKVVWLSSLLTSILIIVISVYRLLHQMAEIPIDPKYADMLPQIKAGLETLLHGENPYRSYHDIASWEIRFVYGPGLWGPFIMPYLLGVDLRLLTLFCGMCIPVVILIYAVVWAKTDKDWGLALLMILASFTICNNHAFVMFFPVAHTPVYWPIILLFCIFFHKKRLWMATLLLGWLMLCRTTMISIAPVYFLFLFKTQRKSIFKHAGLFFLTIILPMLPFIVWDYQALLQNMVFNYTTVIKAYAWNTPDVINISFGLTPLLVQLNLGKCVFLSQIIILSSFYIFVIRIKDDGQWLICMPYALLLFCFTTIWPVAYLFLDVFIFMASILFAERMAFDHSEK